MTLPDPPLPKLSDLVLALGNQPTVLASDVVATPSRFSNHIYQRGSVAIAAGAEAVQRETKSRRLCVWIPDYFCNDALHPLRRLGAQINFYPIRADLTTDWEAASRLIGASNETSIFVLVHYFGFPNQTAEAKKFCDDHSIVLMEDAAHCLNTVSGMGLGDLLIFSPRKLLPSPAGGVLAVTLRWQRMLKPARQYNGRAEVFAWAVQRLIQKTLVNTGMPWHFLKAYRDPPLTSEAHQMNGSGENAGCNNYTLRLLHVLNSRRRAVIDSRRENYKALADAITACRGIKPLFSELPSDVCPYVLPVRLSANAAPTVSALRSKGIPASLWPDLAPEVLANPGSHDTAIRNFEHIMLLPVHQSLSGRDIETIGRRLVEVISAS